MEDSTSVSTFAKEQTSSLAIVREHYKELQAFYAQMLKVDVDYGVIPGTPKPCLYKVGAEKIRLFFNFSIEMARTDQTIDFVNNFYDCAYMATIRNANGYILSQCEGSCNSMEDKYRFIYKTREKQPIPEEVREIEKQKLGRWKTINGFALWQDKVVNDNPFAIKNTMQKIGQKRAYVGAIIVACGGSSIFTQDLKDEEGISEDLVNDAMEELNKVATKEDLADLVSRFENVYNKDEKFKTAVKSVKGTLKK